MAALESQRQRIESSQLRAAVNGCDFDECRSRARYCSTTGTDVLASLTRQGSEAMQPDLNISGYDSQSTPTAAVYLYLTRYKNCLKDFHYSHHTAYTQPANASPQLGHACRCALPVRSPPPNTPRLVGRRLSCTRSSGSRRARSRPRHSGTCADVRQNAAINTQ